MFRAKISASESPYFFTSKWSIVNYFQSEISSCIQSASLVCWNQNWDWNSMNRNQNQIFWETLVAESELESLANVIGIEMIEYQDNIGRLRLYC